MIMEKCLVIFSGGQDSTTLAQWAKKNFDSVSLLGFFYHQKHQIELEQAKIIAKKLNLDFQIIHLDFFNSICDSALFSNTISNVNDAHKTHHNLPASFVPNRNAMFLTIAHSLAQKIHANHLAIGVSEEDYSGYPDCRLDFIQAIEKSLNLGAQTQIQIHTPFIKMTKAQEFALAQELGILEIILKDTHTCYEGIRDTLHNWGYGCGKCNACILRKNAYEKFLSKDY
ncbi:7-cyano-7-deazaguanine synthase QueC [Helicobacter anatolicus]|uniref:7-cyano-7-deazaguanine synthase QueC n=1 Tax=Helicobacter anatolicus TaxID=2905874 RepID=UPI001E41D0A9|nr:7-cyano-7-deazaguanine synthase QueC [Helicobacter anatolicus]MCE3038152.1 7-cyano-7-deazaguanine synthase QueC [Helicobacter anatolicus]